MTDNDKADVDHIYCAAGLMSGTSMDGVDAAIIYTDGETITRHGPSLTVSYPATIRSDLAKAADLAASMSERDDQNAFISKIAMDITDIHAQAVDELRIMLGGPKAVIDVIGFHGHTLIHRPEKGWTWQIGNGGRLAGQTGTLVIDNMRTNDMQHGGQGAPLLPLYHAALLKSKRRHDCVAIVNIGGVANVTWVKFGADDTIESLMAFDTGPGNAMLDDWMATHTGATFDKDGETAASGLNHQDVLMGLMASPYFDETPPKSLDRNDFNIQSIRGLTLEDGAATLTSFVVEAIVAAQSHFPTQPDAWYVCGGGRHNATLMRRLRRHLPKLVDPVEVLGWRGDSLEAEGFAYLAVRALRGLPLTLPSTTGCTKPVSGGEKHQPRRLMSIAR